MIRPEFSAEDFDPFHPSSTQWPNKSLHPSPSKCHPRTRYVQHASAGPLYDLRTHTPHSRGKVYKLQTSQTTGFSLTEHTGLEQSIKHQLHFTLSSKTSRSPPPTAQVYHVVHRKLLPRRCCHQDTEQHWSAVGHQPPEPCGHGGRAC